MNRYYLLISNSLFQFLLIIHPLFAKLEISDYCTRILAWLLGCCSGFQILVANTSKQQLCRGRRPKACLSSSSPRTPFGNIITYNQIYFIFRTKATKLTCSISVAKLQSKQGTYKNHHFLAFSGIINFKNHELKHISEQEPVPIRISALHCWAQNGISRFGPMTWTIQRAVTRIKVCYASLRWGCFMCVEIKWIHFLKYDSPTKLSNFPSLAQ